MNDLSKAWPLGLNGPRWWIAAGAGLVLLALALALDRELLVWAEGWPPWALDLMGQITEYGDSAWILYPSGALTLFSALVGIALPKRLLKLVCFEQAGLFAFIFLGVGLPSITATLLKGLIGRARPMHFDDAGLFSFGTNWGNWEFQSFPSGHATTAFALAAVLGFISARWFVPAIIFAVLIATSRVALGMHYPSDVFAGAVLGLLGAYFVRMIFAQWRVVFVRGNDGHYQPRPVSALRRFAILRRRGSGKGQLPNRS
jgi:membrane-associated phospholipid phosphatase